MSIIPYNDWRHAQTAITRYDTHPRSISSVQTCYSIVRVNASTIDPDNTGNTSSQNTSRVFHTHPAPRYKMETTTRITRARNSSPAEPDSATVSETVPDMMNRKLEPLVLKLSCGIRCSSTLHYKSRRRLTNLNAKGMVQHGWN